MVDAPAMPRVLVVDDEPVLLTFLCRMLEGEGYPCHAVGTAEEALAWLEAHGSDVVVADAMIPFTVVTDVRLPHMNGCALGREIIARWPETRMMFISGYIEAELVAKRICPGNLPLLPKPFYPEDFIKYVDRIIHNPPWHPDTWPETPGEFAQKGEAP